MKKLSIAVLISGSGSNLQAIIDQIAENKLAVEIKVVISNNPDAYGLLRAKKANIATEILSYKKLKNTGQGTREDYDRKLIELIKSYQIDLVVLAGWMYILSPQFLEAFPNQVINLHPAILPSFPGTHAIEQAWNYGVKYTGVTVHFVDSGVDTGPIILQEPIEIKKDDTLEILEERIHKVEHKLLPLAIQLYTEGKLQIEGRKVTIND